MYIYSLYNTLMCSYFSTHVFIYFTFRFKYKCLYPSSSQVRNSIRLYFKLKNDD